MELITGENDDGRRLDRILRKALPDLPLPLIHRLLRQKKILVDNKPGKAQDRISVGAKILIPIPYSQLSTPYSLLPIPQSPVPIPSSLKENKLNSVPEILWQDRSLLAVNKPAGISVHGEGSLDTIVRSYLADKLPPSLSFTPGPLHRLDKPTSGVVIFSVNLEGAHLFSSLLRERKVKKTYLAVIKGCLKNEQVWQDDLLRDKDKKKTFISSKNQIDNINTKTAVTKIIPLMSDNNLTLIKAEISTGRTHQIRAQAAFHGYPLLGDIKYCGMRSEEWGVRNSKKVDIFLHAWRIEFLEYLIEAPVPQTWIPIASRIESTSVFRSGSLPEIPGISTSKG